MKVMDSLRELVEEVNPGLSTQGIDELLSFYSETFAADWARTKPNVIGIEFTNRGYTRLDNQQYLQPNTKIGSFTISVEGSSVEFWVDYDRTGRVSHYGRLIRTNLFNQRAGWAWTSKSPPRVAQSIQRTTGKEGPVLISVEDGSKHYYCLNFNSVQLDGILYTKPSGSEPRNRPSVKGRLVLGNVVGTILTRSHRRLHYVYDTIYVVRATQNGLPPLTQHP